MEHIKVDFGGTCQIGVEGQ